MGSTLGSESIQILRLQLRFQPLPPLIELGKGEHAPPCSSEELCFAENKWWPQRKEFGGRCGYSCFFFQVFVSTTGLESFSLRPENQGKKKHININKFAGLSGTGWVQKTCLCVFFRVIPCGGEKTHKQNSPKIPGQPRENFVYVSFSLCVFFAP